MITVDKILIVDDERQNIKLLTEFLRDDYKIMAAKSGEQALRALDKPALPDLILLDIMMPGIDGYELLRIIKHNDRLKHIPVIFITALESTDDETRGFALGAVDYIRKPFKPVVVKARVRTHMELCLKTKLLTRMASVDGLTGVSNRRSFDTTLDREVRRAARSGEPISLLLMDVDYFKRYNDTYGHAEGDTCLKRVAAAATGIPRRAADYVARYGGEEFAIILPNTHYEGAMKIAQDICAAVMALQIPHSASDVAPNVTVSAGVTTSQGSRELTPLKLIRSADAALYEAKRQGRNGVKGNEM